jgi:hypothetical protein
MRHFALCTEAPRMTYACHCTDCQRMTSSAFFDGDRRFRNRLPPDKGRAAFDPTHRRQRPDEHTLGLSRLRLMDLRRPESQLGELGAVRAVRAGTLDDTSWLRPTAHLWTRSKQPWVALPESSRSFETQPTDLAEFFASGDETKAIG